MLCFGKLHKNLFLVMPLHLFFIQLNVLIGTSMWTAFRLVTNPDRRVC